MISQIKNFIRHPLISGSTIMLASSFVSNLFNWVFNLLIGGRHLLSVSDYGIYSTLMSLWALIAIFGGSLSSIFTKFVVKYSIDKDTNLKPLLSLGSKFTLLFGLILFVALIIADPFLSWYLHINFWLLFLL